MTDRRSLIDDQRTIIIRVPDVRIHHLQFASMYRPAQMYRQQQMTGRRRMRDRRSLSGSLNVTAGSGIRDSEGGATHPRRCVIHILIIPVERCNRPGR